MKIDTYKTAGGANVVELDESVNELIRQGFQPFGSPYYIAPSEGVINSPFCQAMVMYLVEYND